MIPCSAKDASIETVTKAQAAKQSTCRGVFNKPQLLGDEYSAT